MSASVTAKHCWDKRGCDGVFGLSGPMSSECPHARTDCYSPCPIDCNFAQCMRSTHKVATDMLVLLDPDVDRTAPIKEVCRFCEFFLTHGPRLGEDGPANATPSRATSSGEGRSTVHFF